jgi:7,8-dihydropterin-6-yl-methyl-4-(beta-D-ribofuranosyl)aminobenzene 5'-phosphate synthase
LSLWIDTGSERVLFDTGQTDAYVRNAQALGIDLSQTQAIVLSHGHYDHGGGLAFLPQAARWPRVFAHPDAFLPRTAWLGRDPASRRPIGLPWQRAELTGLEQRLMLNTATMQIGDSCVACAGVRRVTAFEEPAEGLFVEEVGIMRPDCLLDEQFLVCQLPQGLVVVLGCSHPGVINCLMAVRQLFPDRPIRAVIGGMHLEQAGAERIRQTIGMFVELEIAHIIPLHCTGQAVIWQMKQALGDRLLTGSVGDVLTL